MLIALDSLVLVWLTLGAAHPSETISSAAFRAELHGMWFGLFRVPIDLLFSGFEDNHCRCAYDYAIGKRNLPEDMR